MNGEGSRLNKDLIIREGMQAVFVIFAARKQPMKNIRLVATDLDGTFLKDNKSISASNMEALHFLGDKGIVRIAATGRNLQKAEEVIPAHIPFDFIIYSSGAGIFNRANRHHLYTQNIPEKTAHNLMRFFISEDLNFHVFRPAPQNHLLWYHRGSKHCDEFERYFEYHKDLATPLPANGRVDSDVCQFLVVIPGNEAQFSEMKARIGSFSQEICIIRASSPLQTGYIWIEIFHKNVSKGNSLLYLCNLLKIDPENTLGIGNDYNDIDLLEFTAHSFLTDNAPEVLKKHYVLTPTNEEDAFAHVISQISFQT
jgi:Cof subfamily protein (haloacid dehalogenase superfamily)